MMKSSTPVKEICSVFLEHKGERDSVHIYSDGLKMEDRVGFAEVLPFQALNGGLPKNSLS